MIFPDTTYRTELPEIMDDFSLTGNTLRDALDKIASINQLLGGNKLTVSGVMELIRELPKQEPIHIIDIGCGNGDMLRTLAKEAAKKGLHFQLTGIDANAYTVSHAESLSKEFTNIDYLTEDIFTAGFAARKYDIALCTLTLHHFTDEEITSLLSLLYQNSRLGIVINDLERSGLAYRLFQALCFVFRLNDMSREDGLVSILRGFKKKELRLFSQKLNFKKYSIRWKWAFRYQWIIQKT